jgi:hypothetical protein
LIFSPPLKDALSACSSIFKDGASLVGSVSLTWECAKRWLEKRIKNK